MASYALLESLTGVRYDSIEKTLYVCSYNIGYGFVKLEDSIVSIDVRSGKNDIDNIVFI